MELKDTDTPSTDSVLEIPRYLIAPATAPYGITSNSSNAGTVQVRVDANGNQTCFGNLTPRNVTRR